MERRDIKSIAHLWTTFFTGCFFEFLCNFWYSKVSFCFFFNNKTSDSPFFGTFFPKFSVAFTQMFKKSKSVAPKLEEKFNMVKTDP